MAWPDVAEKEARRILAETEPSGQGWLVGRPRVDGTGLGDQGIKKILAEALAAFVADDPKPEPLPVLWFDNAREAYAGPHAHRPLIGGPGTRASRPVVGGRAWRLLARYYGRHLLSRVRVQRCHGATLRDAVAQLTCIVRSWKREETT